MFSLTLSQKQISALSSRALLSFSNTLHFSTVWLSRNVMWLVRLQILDIKALFVLCIFWMAYDRHSRETQKLFP